MKKKQSNMQTLFFKNILLATTFIFLVIFTVTSIFIVRDSFKMIKESRIDVLTQIRERTQTLNLAIQNLTEDLYTECADILTTYDSEQYITIKSRIETIIEEKSLVYKSLDMDPDVIILMKDQNYFSSSSIPLTDIEQITSSYWYIDNIINPKPGFWSSKCTIRNHQNALELCYVQSILNAESQYIGSIIVSISSDYLKEIYQDMINNNCTFYVLDQNGYTISHSITSLLGCQLYYMPYFWQQQKPNSSAFIHKNTGYILQTNSFDKRTGITIVEEIDFYVLINNFSSVFQLGVFLFILCLILSICISYILSKKISGPIVDISKQMIQKPFQPLYCSSTYKEATILCKTYNTTITKMDLLIERIKQEEEQKHKLELSFLQAQINPHFLHNTLFTIKCLIEMRDNQKAYDMLTQLMQLLKIPFNAKKEWISVNEEIDYLKSYLSLMQYRYQNKHLSMDIYLEPGLEDMIIPRLLLQPIIENSIFHGFDDSCKNGIISLSFRKIQEKVVICIRDNGKGMSQSELDNLWSDTRKNKNSFNHISLINIKQRIQLLYGDEYGITIVSEPGQGIETLLTIACKKEDIQND